MTKILIFTGAGLSVPLGLPATNGFDNTISKIPSVLWPHIEKYLKKDGNPKDIERVLYLLENFVKEDDFTRFLLREGKANSHYKIVYDNLEAQKANANHAIFQIKADIFELLAKFDANRAFQLYSGILNEIRSEHPNSAFSIFTTNYDLTFENAVSDNEDELLKLGFDNVYYSFQAGRFGRQAYNGTEDFAWNPKIIEYKKLHGSLDWVEDNGRIFKTGVTNRPKDPGEMPVLYPGYKGIPSSPPYSDMHEWLLERLDQADIVFVLGFAFRDQYINNIFDFVLKKKKEIGIFCYNPATAAELPADSYIPSFTRKYSDKFFHIKSPVEVSDSPLKLSDTMTNLGAVKILEEFQRKRNMMNML
ncbi:MAG: SIR2 family protein [Bacteroidia bacterium]